MARLVAILKWHICKLGQVSALFKS